MWPPDDFELIIEEIHVDDGAARVVRRFRAGSDGVVAYATSSSSVVDAESATLLPVFDRLAVYQLVPTSIRALARRLDQAGIADLERVQGERSATDGPSLAVVWHAFGRRQVITARGRVHGAMAEILAVVAAHLPPGETFGLPGEAERPVVPVLRGVPVPVSDAIGALRAHQDLLALHPDDRALMLDAFALACQLARRDTAEGLLRRWTEATADQRRQQEMFPEGEPRLTPEVLQRLLPAP
ncbi:MAG: hypothetical protein ABIP94_02490 [Planctomycetota bacterium]